MMLTLICAMALATAVALAEETAAICKGNCVTVPNCGPTFTPGGKANITSPCDAAVAGSSGTCDWCAAGPAPVPVPAPGKLCEFTTANISCTVIGNFSCGPLKTGGDCKNTGTPPFQHARADNSNRPFAMSRDANKMEPILQESHDNKIEVEGLIKQWLHMQSQQIIPALQGHEELYLLSDSGKKELLNRIWYDIEAGIDPGILDYRLEYFVPANREAHTLDQIADVRWMISPTTITRMARSDMGVLAVCYDQIVPSGEAMVGSPAAVCS